jgi:hypothetical protein
MFEASLTRDDRKAGGKKAANAVSRNLRADLGLGEGEDGRDGV